MAVTAEAARLRAQGAQLADFGAGEPHFATPRHIKDAAIAAIEDNFTRYTVVAGIPEVRKAIVERHACDFGSDYTPDEAIFTTGGKLALFNAIQVLVDHGDEVILPVPYWVPSRTSFSMPAARLSFWTPRRRRISASPPRPSSKPLPREPRRSSLTRHRIQRLRHLPRRPGTHCEAGPRRGIFCCSTSAMSTCICRCSVSGGSFTRPRSTSFSVRSPRPMP